MNASSGSFNRFLLAMMREKIRTPEGVLLKADHCLLHQVEDRDAHQETAVTFRPRRTRTAGSPTGTSRGNRKPANLSS